LVSDIVTEAVRGDLRSSQARNVIYEKSNIFKNIDLQTKHVEMVLE